MPSGVLSLSAWVAAACHIIHARIHRHPAAFCAAIQEVSCHECGLQHSLGHTQHLLLRHPCAYPPDTLQDRRGRACDTAHAMVMGPCQGSAVEQRRLLCHTAYRDRRGVDDSSCHRPVPRCGDILQDRRLLPLLGHDNPYPHGCCARHTQPSLPEDNLPAVGFLL